MSAATIQLRIGLQAAVATATVADGEPLWTTDTHVLYVGQGGIPVAITGSPGPAGSAGPTGATGATGPGVPAGGDTGALLVKASATDFDSAWIGANVGSTRKVLTSTGVAGAGSSPIWDNWITATVTLTTLTATYTISADNAWQATGLTLTLPTAGSYLVWFNARGGVAISAGSNAFVSVRLFDQTAGAAIPNSERQCCLASAPAVGTVIGTAACLAYVIVPASHVLRLEALRSGTAPTWSLSGVFSDGNGRSAMGYVKIGE